MNKELINELKHIKACLVSRDMTGTEWEERQEALRQLEEVVTYLNDATEKGIDFEG